METFLKETSFHGIMLDSMFNAPNEAKEKIQKALADVLKSGAVKPLSRTIFACDELEQAYRYMAAGKHIGKVLIQLRSEETQKIIKPSPVLFDAMPRFLCNSDSTYVILGGLGGFGLELADWLCLCGAKKLVLSSRTGVRTGYQVMRIKVWETYGVTVKISTDDISTEEGITNLLKESNKLGPVSSIFNLAVVLKDRLFENMTEEDFIASAAPKVYAAKLLDKVSRVLCPKLEHFVMFSSISCGRGNPGQANYGWSNSVMERICEERKKDKLPGTAIQWGAIGDVGIIIEAMSDEKNNQTFNGTLLQRINSCLELLDVFITGDDPVVASMIIAEKNVGAAGAGNIVDTVVNILGLRDLKTVSMHSTLAELGMDSMMAVEIKQTLEREFEVFLTPQDIRGMTFSKLQDIAKASESNEDKPEKSEIKGDISLKGIDFLIRLIGEEHLYGEPIIRLPSLASEGTTSEDISQETVFLIPGIEGVSTVMEPLAKNLSLQSLCLQFNYDDVKSVEQLAASLLPHVLKRLQPGKGYNMVGYSFGGLVALELVLLLEAAGYVGKLILIDSSPDFMKLILNESFQGGMSDHLIQIQVLLRVVSLLTPQNSTQIKELLLPLTDWQSKLKVCAEHIVDNKKYSKQFQLNTLNASYYKINALKEYNGLKPESVASSVTLIRPTLAITSGNVTEDYGLSKYTKSPVSVMFVEGDHSTVLESKRTAEIINELLDVDDLAAFKKSIMSTPCGTIASLHQQIKHM